MVQSRRDDGEIQAHKCQTYARGSLITWVVVLAACQPVGSPAPTLSLTGTLSPHALAATGTAAPRLLPTMPPSPSPEPTKSAPATSGPIPSSTAAPRVGLLSFPSISGDAGNAVLIAGDEITIVWEEAPPGAERYEFTFEPEDVGPAVLLGEDLDPSDGVSVRWTVPEHLAGGFDAVAHFADGSTASVGWSAMIYSGTAPPAGICVLQSSTVGVVMLFLEPTTESADFADVYPGEYAEVLGHTADDWFLVDAGMAHLTFPRDPQPATGWTPDHGLVLRGPCEDLPLIDE